MLKLYMDPRTAILDSFFGPDVRVRLNPSPKPSLRVYKSSTQQPRFRVEGLGTGHFWEVPKRGAYV